MRPIQQPKSLIEQSAVDALPVTLDAEMPPCRAVVVGTAGNIKLDTVGKNTVTLLAIPAGILPLSVTKIHTTGTTAANLSYLY